MNSIPFTNAVGETCAGMQAVSRVATSAEATANAFTLDFSTLGSIDGLPLVQIITTAGAANTAGLTVTVSGTTVTVAATSIAATDTITAIAFGNKNA